MKKRLGKLIRNEKGQGLAIVLCLLAIGGLTIVPLLNYMYGGLRADSIYREKMALRYAADAGLEDGIWKSDNDNVSLEPYDYETVYNYSLPEEINNAAVNVSIRQIWPLAGLESDVNGTTPASELLVTGGVVNAEGGFQVRLAYDNPEVPLPVDRVAVWLPPGFEYVTDSSEGLTTANPTEVAWNGGTALEWDFDPAIDYADLPLPGQGDPLEGGMTPGAERPALRLLEFEVTPQGEVARGSYSWLRTTDSSLYLAWERNITIYRIDSTATDTATGKAATATGYTYVSEGIDTSWIDTGGIIFTGNYRAIGNSLMLDTDGDPNNIRDTVLTESSCALTDIPVDGQVAFAYLYWAGWYYGQDEDTTCTFKIDMAEIISPNDYGDFTQCEPVGDSPNYQCVDEAAPDGDSTYVLTGHTPEILRPDANGTYSQCDAVGDFPNYQCVDEAISDGDSTYVRTRYGATERDTYNIDDHTLGSGTINSVTVHTISKSDSSYVSMAAETIIRTYGNDYYGTYTTLPGGGGWQDLSTIYTTNPNTGSAWTWAEIDALEAGVRHYDLGSGTVRTTQVYVEVDYGPTGTEEDIDTYDLENHGQGSGTIDSVTVYVRTRGTSSADTHAAETVIRTYGNNYYGTYTLLPTSYTDLSTTYTTNPNTGSAWTWAEIDALQAGVKQYDQGPGGVHTTQVYVYIDYGSSYEGEITADTWWLVQNSTGYCYSCFKDVTSIVESISPGGNAIYTVGDVDSETGEQLSSSGWSLIIIYSSPSEAGHQFYLWNLIIFAGGNTEGTFVIEGFQAPEDAEASITCFITEGDEHLTIETLQFNGTSLYEDPINPSGNIWNSKSSGLRGEFIDGVDIDTFDISSPIINPGDTSAEVRFTTQQDHWNLIYMILAFRSDLAVLIPSGTGIYSYGF